MIVPGRFLVKVREGSDVEWFVIITRASGTHALGYAWTTSHEMALDDVRRSLTESGVELGQIATLVIRAREMFTRVQVKGASLPT